MQDAIRQQVRTLNALRYLDRLAEAAAALLYKDGDTGRLEEVLADYELSDTHALVTELLYPAEHAS